MARTMSDLRRVIARMENRPGPAETLDVAAPANDAGQQRGDAFSGYENKASTNAVYHDSPTRSLAFGLDAVDALFAGGGLALNALHEIHAPEARAAGAATGFLAGLLTNMDRSASERGRPVLWVQDPVSAREAGRLHGPGLNALGGDPQQVVTVHARSVPETLWALEEGLDCSGLGAVIGEVCGVTRALDLTATRRLALRAARAEKPVLLMRTSAPPDCSAARTRWLVTPASSRALDGYHAGLGRAAWQIELVKNRDGPTARWIVEWNHYDPSFSLVTPDSVAVAAAPGDRPARPQALGSVVALRRAS
ncbi:MAG: DNA repair protein [Pseudomonadota bacterium]